MEAATSAHDLLAAYALNALDESERQSFEAHLGECGRCRDELASLEDSAAALAFDAPPAQAPAELRDRLLERARDERPPARVVPLRRYAWPAVAAAAVAAAVVLAIWAASLHGSLSRERDARDARDSALAVLADPTTRYVRLRGEDGVLAVTREGRAALALTSLARAPGGRTYEAWVIGGGGTKPAGLFGGNDAGATLVSLSRPVPAGATVAVTVERRGGVKAPTSPPILTAKSSA